jgi:hypothetical protein
VRITVLAALGSWLARAGESIPADCAIFFSAGLKEKEMLRRAHLRCLRQALKNQDLVNKVSLSYFSLIIGTLCFFIFTIAHFWLPFSHVFQMQLTWVASHVNEHHLCLNSEGLLLCLDAKIGGATGTIGEEWCYKTSSTNRWHLRSVASGKDCSCWCRIRWVYRDLHVVCIAVLSHSLHPCVSSLFKFHNCGSFLNFVVSANLFFAATVLGSSLNFWPFWSGIFVHKAVELERLFIAHFWCVGLFTDDVLMKEKIWNIVLQKDSVLLSPSLVKRFFF